MGTWQARSNPLAWRAGALLAIGAGAGCGVADGTEAAIDTAPAPLIGVPAGLGAEPQARLLDDGAAFRTQQARFPPRSLRRPVRVVVPRDASQPFFVEDRRSGVGVGVRVQVASGSEQRELVAGVGIQRDATGQARVVFRATPVGIEDHVRVDDAGAAPELSFTLELQRVAGLRLVASTLELLDERGTPQLRAHAPHVVDARGRVRAASLHVDDCAVDHSGAAPWGRPVTFPGASTCTLTVRWERAGLVYPVWVDPYWASTGDLAMGHASAPAARLGNGWVLYAGGADVDGSVSGVELFDPESQTWTVTHGTPQPSGQDSMTAVGARDAVLVAIGGEEPLRYDGVSGEWRSVPLPSKHADTYFALLATLSDGKVLYVPADSVDETWLFDPADDSWRAVAGRHPRLVEGIAPQPDGTVLLLGWYAGDEQAPFCERAHVTSLTEWSVCAELPMVLEALRFSRLPDGTTLAAGGNTPNFGRPGKPTFHSFGYDAIGDGWYPLGDLLDAVGSPVSLAIGSGVIAGGRLAGAKGPIVNASMVSIEHSEWKRIDSMNERRIQHRLVALDDQRVLAAGGIDENSEGLRTAELLLPGRSNGAGCEAGDQCDSGHCVRGICCNEACTGSCEACTAYDTKDGEDGTCALALACSQTCASNLECADGATCSAERRCVEPATVAGEVGCATHDRGARTGWKGCLALVLGAGVWSARRHARRG